MLIVIIDNSPMKYKNIREEALKNKVGVDWFNQFDTTEIIGNIDFTVFPKQDNLFGRTPLLWAEAKTEREARKIAWNKLTDEQKDACGCFTCVDEIDDSRNIINGYNVEFLGAQRPRLGEDY